jgi:DNA-binding beta-propeller fold protein YncE/cytochrome c peroxidase
MDGRRSASFLMLALGMAVAAGWSTLARPDASVSTSPTARIRQPVAAGLLGDGRTLCIANRRSGTLSCVDLRQARLLGEQAVGEQLADLAVLPDGKHVLTIDENKHELIALACDGGHSSVRARLTVGPYPAAVAVRADGRRAVVASSWSRKVEVIDLTPLSSGTGPVRLRVLHAIRLPFAPRGLCVLPGRPEVVVADAFGGHLAVVDAEAGRVCATHELAGHNIRGLALDAGGKNLVLSHQVLDQHAPTTRQNIERGLLMANVARFLPLGRVVEPGADLERAGRLVRLGGPGAGAADPAGLAVLEDGRLLVALSGVNEAALIDGGGRTVRRVPVGHRPTVILPGKADWPAVVLNTFDDSLSLLDARRGAVVKTISLGPRPALGPADRGEMLFFNAALARDRWMSCHSCHTDGHTNGLLADTTADNTFGTPKRTLTLRNTALTDPWAWNGEGKYLHDQVQKSLAETMHAPSVSGEQVGDLVSFLHTLPAPPPLAPAGASEADRAEVERGRRFFEERGCVHCHIPPLTYNSPGTHDVGFSDERGLRRFNAPSLRGVGQGYRFLHDNRAASLEEVFTKFHHKVGPDLPADELADLLRFLRSL